MRRAESIKNSVFWLVTAVLAIFLSQSCSREKGPDYDAGKQGRVRFEIVRNNVYSISDLAEISTIKIWLMDSEENVVELPSLDVSGTETLLYTEYVVLDAGSYRVVEYRCYDLQANLIDGLDIRLEKENQLEITAGEDTEFPLPVKVKQVISTSNLYNTLRGICLEILGDDESLWPASWDFESGEIDIDWAGLEFDTDANSNPTDVIGLVINGEPEYIINSDTWEQILVSLVEFRNMEVLPACISNLTGLESLVVKNCDMQEIPSELQYSMITSLTVENTRLQSLPDELSEMKRLTSAEFYGNRMTMFPECLTGVSTMEIFTIDNERIGSVPESIGNWGENLVSLSIRNTDIAELPDVFDRLWHVSMPDFSGNRNLSCLPASIGLEEIPYGDDGSFSRNGITGLILDGCAFTQIPEEVQRRGMYALYMADNKINKVSAEDIESIPDLETLVLDGNRLESFPALTNSKLSMLSLIGTGLSREQVDISGMPQLNPRYVFFTQEDYDSVFGMK
ncbi:MAG: hypothetical protein MJY79_07070 [Bacteroidaceae bacterium]|nr:hypothetical protein [Bacteroidaceae bacterium]